MGLIVKVYPVGHTSLVVPVCSRLGNNYFKLFKEKNKICYKPEQGSLCSHFYHPRSGVVKWYLREWREDRGQRTEESVSFFGFSAHITFTKRFLGTHSV